MLLASPHFVPSGWPVAATGREMVAQLLTVAHKTTAANNWNTLFMISSVKRVEYQNTLRIYAKFSTNQTIMPNF